MTSSSSLSRRSSSRRGKQRSLYDPSNAKQAMGLDQIAEGQLVDCEAVPTACEDYDQILKPKGWKRFKPKHHNWGFIPASISENARLVQKHGEEGFHFALGWQGLQAMLDQYGINHAPRMDQSSSDVNNNNHQSSSSRVSLSPTGANKASATSNDENEEQLGDHGETSPQQTDMMNDESLDESSDTYFSPDSDNENQLVDDEAEFGNVEITTQQAPSRVSLSPRPNHRSDGKEAGTPQLADTTSEQDIGGTTADFAADDENHDNDDETPQQQEENNESDSNDGSNTVAFESVVDNDEEHEKVDMNACAIELTDLHNLRKRLYIDISSDLASENERFKEETTESLARVNSRINYIQAMY